jgi:AhpD family alkylhydroperoxidase
VSPTSANPIPEGDASPRLPPLPREQWGDDVRAALSSAYSDEVAARFFSTGPDAIPTGNALATLMRHPALAGPFLTYNNVLLQTPTLDPRARELLILRVAWRTQCHYEWAQHVRLAGRVGITAEEIAAVARNTPAEVWSALEADLLTAADQLVGQYRVDDDTWARLAEQLDERQLVELLFVVGTYTGLAMVFNGLGLQVDAELHALASTSLPDIEE